MDGSKMYSMSGTPDNVDLVCLANNNTDLRGHVPRTSLEMHAFLLAVYLEVQYCELSCRIAAHFQMYLLMG